MRARHLPALLFAAAAIASSPAAAQSGMGVSRCVAGGHCKVRLLTVTGNATIGGTLTGTSAAFSGNVTALSFTATAGNNADALILTPGAEIQWGAGTARISGDNGTTVTFKGDAVTAGTHTATDYRCTGTATCDINGHAASGTTVFTFDASNALAAGLHSSWRENGTSVLMTLDHAGLLTPAALTTTGAAVVGTNLTVNGSSNLGPVVITDETTLEALHISSGFGIDYAGKCDSTGAPGAATCNQHAGRAAIAAAASSVVITDSLAAATSIVHATLQANDATCTSVRSVIPAAGSFTIHVPAACTADTVVGWTLVN